MKKGYVWYSFGSDKTGPELGRMLEFDAGKKTPPFASYEVVLGWGCKPGSKYNPEGLAQAIAQGRVRILNHPDAVEKNRNKLDVLQRLKALNISVPGFFAFDPGRPVVAAQTLIPDALNKGVLALPLVLHNESHKGDPILCYTMEDVTSALEANTKKESPISYARTYDHGDEYRIHVFRDVAMFAQKKVLEDDPVTAAATSLIERCEGKWEREKRRVTAAEKALIHEVSMYLAGDILKSASQAQKSVSMGWKFMDWNMDLVPPEVAGLAIEALDAVHLDLGAVSISYANKVPRLLSITTAPNLSPEQMATYVVEVKAFIEKGGKTKAAAAKKVAKKENKASPELVARLYRKVKDLSAEKAEAVLKSLEE